MESNWRLDQPAGMGIDEGTPVREASKAHDNRFRGKIAKVGVAVK
jgi:hypothetical protein